MDIKKNWNCQVDILNLQLFKLNYKECNIELIQSNLYLSIFVANYFLNIYFFITQLFSIVKYPILKFTNNYLMLC